MPSPGRVRWAKFRSTVVILGGLAILGTLFSLLTGGTLFEEKATLYVFIPDSTGIGPGSPVRVDGIGVGKVHSVGLSGETDPLRIVKVVAKLERKNLVKIPSDSYVELTAETMIGDKYVDISAGVSKQPVRPNTELPFHPPTDMFKSLDLQQFQQRLRVVDRLITDIERGQSRVGRFVMGDQVYRDLRKRVAEIQTGFHEAASATSVFGSAVYSDTLYRRFEDPILALDQSLAKLQSGQGIGKHLSDAAAYEEIASGIAGLRRSVEEMRQGPFLASASMYEGWVNVASSIIQKVDEFNGDRLLSTTATYESLNGALVEWAGTIKDFRENPKKYLRVKVF
jgi:phospholipid/cholesterol/gamma-HCH transport system substrate-binding protein